MSKKKKFGFTLVELLVVIAILAILAAVSVVGYLGFTEKAKLSNDESLVNQLNTMVKSENALDDFIDVNEFKILYEENTGKSFYDLEPQTAHKGNHFWFNENKQEVILAKSNDLIENIRNKKMSLASESQNKDLRASLIEGYYLLDSKGSRLGETLFNYDNVTGKEAYLSLVNNTTSLMEDKFDSTFREKIDLVLNNTIFVTDEGNYAKNNDNHILKLQENIQYISNSKNVISDNNKFVISNIDENNHLVNSSIDLVIPDTVSYVASKALSLNEESSISFAHNNIEDLTSVIEPDFTNKNFYVNDTLCAIKDDKIIEVNTNKEYQITTTITIKSFKIAVEGQKVNDANYVVALNDEENQFRLYGYDFVAELDGKEIVGVSTNLEFVLNNADENNRIDGNLLHLKDGGEYQISATVENAKENETANYSITIRANAITNIAIKYDDNVVQADGETKKVTIINNLETVFAYHIEFGMVYPEFADLLDKTINVSSDNNKVIVNADNKISVNPEVEQFTLTFTSGNGIEVNQKFVVERKFEQFEAVKNMMAHYGEFLYKAGNLNEINLNNFFSLDEELIISKNINPEDIELEFKIINSRDNTELEKEKYILDEKYYEIDFNDEFNGVVRIEITSIYNNDILNTITIPLEILDGNNIYDNDDLLKLSSTNNKFLMNDIYVSKYHLTTIVNGFGLFGNGFKIDGSSATTRDKMQWDGIVNVTNAIVDNIEIVGKTFSKITWYEKEYSANTLNLDGSYCEVHNTKTYGSRSSISINCETFLSNVIAEGGVLSNIHVNTSAEITLNNVTTIQNPNSEYIPSESTFPIGLGIYIDVALADNFKIVLEGYLHQYNWINEELADKLDAEYKMVVKELISKHKNEYGHEINGNLYFNFGIVFIADNTQASEKIIDNRTDKNTSYEIITETKLGIPASAYSITNVCRDYVINNQLFDSSDNERIYGTYQTKPKFVLTTNGIEGVYSPSISGDTLQVHLSNDNPELNITENNGLITVTYYGEEYTELVTLDSTITVNFGSARNLISYATLKSPIKFDAHGNALVQEQSFEYQFWINSILDIENATWELTNEVVEGKTFYYQGNFISGYKTNAFILEGLVISDFDGAKFVKTDYTNYPALPDKLVIKKFNGGMMGNSELYTITTKNNKVVIQSQKGSKEKRSETMTVVLEYTCYNGNKIEIVRTFNFTSNTKNNIF